jgi:hypothetical protein
VKQSALFSKNFSAAAFLKLFRKANFARGNIPEGNVSRETFFKKLSKNAFFSLHNVL